MALPAEDKKMLKALWQFFFQHGHSYVPATDGQYRALYLWMKELRKHKDKLPSALVESLDEMQFDWHISHAQDQAWYFRYEQLKKFYEEHGHAHVPYEHPELGHWVSRQRQQENSMSPQKKRLLNELGFKWKDQVLKEKQEDWLQMYEQLKAFHATHGHTTVPVKQRSLRYWVDLQRRHLTPFLQKDTKEKDMYLPEEILTERIRLLDELNFQWQDTRWQEMYKQLQKFREKHGHCFVPGVGKQRKLGLWVRKQRARKQHLDTEQIMKLNQLGFVWEEVTEAISHTRWQEMYKKLDTFYERYGHSQVTRTYEDKELANWVSTQRNNKEALTQKQIMQLNKLSFPWADKLANKLEQQWESFYQALAAFKKEHGHVDLPQRFPENQPLSNWVHRQRRMQDRLSQERKRKLEKLGFTWLGEQAESLWQSRYKELEQFHRQHGHALIKVTEDPVLWRWLYQQKKHWNRLPTEKKQQLQSLGINV